MYVDNTSYCECCPITKDLCYSQDKNTIKKRIKTMLNEYEVENVICRCETLTKEQYETLKEYYDNVGFEAPYSKRRAEDLMYAYKKENDSLSNVVSEELGLLRETILKQNTQEDKETEDSDEEYSKISLKPFETISKNCPGDVTC